MKALQSLDQLLWATLSCSDRNESDMYDFHQDQDKSPRERQPKISKMVVNHVICNSGSIIGDQKENPECMTLPGIPSHEFDCDPFIRCALNKHITRILTIYLTHHKSLESDVGFRLPDSETELCQESAMELSDLISYVWERLNTGHWKSIPCLWRKLYTCLSIIKISFMVLQGLPDLEIIRVCDMALLMGEPICGNVLCAIGGELSNKIICETKSKKRCPSPVNTYEVNVTPLNQKFGLKNKTANEFQICTSEKPSLERFLSIMNSHTPVKLLGIVDHWPAVEKWSVDYIDELAGFRTVPVEVGQKYTSEEWTQKIMTIGEFIEKYMRLNNDCLQNSDQIAYVAQYNLFDQLPQLANDIRIPDYCLSGADSSNVEINAWFGPANTISPTHYDPKHNILVQVFGSKILRLFPPSESTLLRPHEESSILFNTSQLDIEQTNLFDLYRDTRRLKHCDVILNAKEALYIPPKWWHYVKSLTPSFSVSFWFE